MLRFVLALIPLVAFGAEAPAPAPPDAEFKSLDPKFQTEHLPLLKRHAKGPVKAFFLVPADSTLGHVREIVQRADIEPDYAAIARAAPPADGLHADDLAAFQAKLAAGAPQALVTLGIQWHTGLKAKLIGELLERVRGGLGAVVAVRDLREEPELAAALAGGKELTGEPTPAVAVEAAPVRRFVLGKGRVALVVCRWSNRGDAGEAALGAWTRLRQLRGTVAIEELRWRGFEYSYACLADLIRWAAGLESPVTVTDAALKDNVVSVAVHNAAEKLTTRLHVAVRSRRWEARTTGEAQAELTPGEGRHTVTLGKAPDSGPLALEVTVRGPDGKTLAFGSVGAAGDEAVTLKITPQPQFQSPDRRGPCVVEVTGALPGGRLEVTVTDRFGRLVSRSDHPVRLENGAAKAAFMLQGFRPLSVYHEVVARLYSAEAPGRLLAEAAADVFLLPPKPPYADAFAPGVAGAPERSALMLQAMLPAIRELGLSLHTDSRDDRVLYASGGVKAAQVAISPPDKPALDPAAAAAAKGEWQKRAKAEYETGARLVSLGDERAAPDDFGFSPEAVARFREWLGKRYANIAELNKAWGTAFADFAQVAPKRRRELGESPNLAPWLEFRAFIGEALGDHYVKAPAEWAAEIAPDLAVGERGIREPSADWPVDWSRYANRYKLAARLGETQGVLEDLFRSFAPEARQGSVITLGVQGAAPAQRIGPWLSLLNGGSVCWLDHMSDRGPRGCAVLTSDQRPTAAYAALAKEEFPDLTGGIDRLILASRFLDDRIAIAYSYPSWLADTDALARDAKAVVEELGFQHVFVNMEDVAAGRLEKDGFKLLVIQQASCLSKEQVEGIRRFAEAGGIVLAVGRSGWRDLRGAPHAEGCLVDALAGVDTAKSAPFSKVMAMPRGQPSLTLEVALGGVEARDAKVLASVAVDGKAPLPVWTVRNQGKGKVYWLNATLRGGEATRKSHHDLFDHVIAMASIKPRCRLFEKGAPLFDTETWYYESPLKRTLFVAHYLGRKTEGPVMVRFDRKAHVYEVRTRRAFGETDVVHDAFPQGVMRIYALLDCRLLKLTAKVEEQKYDPGGVVNVVCSMTTAGKEAEPPDLLAYRVKLLDPSGRELPAYSQVVLAPGGDATVALPLALDQPPGRHTVLVADVITGQEARAPFLVTKPAVK